MILTTILSTVPAKFFLGFTAIFGTLLAIGEATSDRTLIYLSIIGSLTTIIVSVVGAFVSWLNSRKLAKVAELPKTIGELSISLDGRLQELMESKEKAAYSAGGEQERVEERGRQTDAAAVTATPVPVTVENPKNKPAHVKLSGR